MTRVTFSESTGRLKVSLPSRWEELSQAELLDFYSLKVTMNASGADDMAFHLFAMLTGCRVLGRDDDHYTCRLWATLSESGKTQYVKFRVTPDELAELLAPLSFVDEPGTVPVRPDRFKGVNAVDASLHGVSFGDYLQLENLYQGFLATRNTDAVIAMAAILYPGLKRKRVNEVSVVAVLQWMVQIKNLFSKNWPNFFRPSSPGSGSPLPMVEVMNNEIRALTGGDISKEQEIFESDCWRALTELDFKAKDAEEMKRSMSKK